MSSQQNVDVLVNDVDQFGLILSAKVNWDKSEALSVEGVLENKLVLPRGLIWKMEGLKYLGIFFR